MEPRTGVFVGHVSGRVRDALWEKCRSNSRVGGVIQIWSSNTEQRFQMRSEGDTSRVIVSEEGLQLVKIPGESEKSKRLKKNSGKINLENKSEGS
ncbi:MAG: type I-E CRISPR-associated endoribonuclease Cas2e [Flexilinea sp.]